jgi:tagaturonate reductase
MIQKLTRSATSHLQQKPVKVLQFGKGNFLRAFVDWMVDIANETSGFNGAVQIVQSNSTEDDLRFHDQGGLYHVVINGIRNGIPVREIRLITCVSGVINPFADYNTFLKAGENPDLRLIVSNTTEAGISFDASDAGPEKPSRTFPGKLAALLLHRYRFFGGDPSKGVTVLPCELIERNGEMLRNAIDQYITHWRLEEGFRKWVHLHTGFCNTLVDRIVPGFPKEEAQAIWEQTGYRDDLLVAAEPYHLWVIQPLGDMPEIIVPLLNAGFDIKVVGDLAPYRTSKVRILNGAHTCMVPVAWLAGLRTVREAVEDPVTGSFIRDIIRHEIVPTLDMPVQELSKFADDVMERLQNPFIRHELRSIALNAIPKFQVRVLPTILDYHQRTGKLPDGLLRAMAALLRFYKGEWKGETIPLKDSEEVLSFFARAWRGADPAVVVREVLSNKTLWQTDLTKIDGMAARVEKHLRELGS